MRKLSLRIPCDRATVERCFVCILAGAVLTSAEFFASYLNFFTLSLFTSIAVLWSASPNRKHWFVAAAISALYLPIYGREHYLLAFAAGCAVVLIHRGLSQSQDPLKASLPFLFYVATVGLMIAVGAFIHLSPHILDAQLRAFDQQWFGDISTRLWQSSQSYPLLLLAFHYIYVSLPAAIILLVNNVDRGRGSAMLKAAATAGVFGFFCYIAFPAVGPAHIHEPVVPRNCMPSLHVTWALLCMLYARPGRQRWILACFATLTAIATLVVGEHYVLDLIAAIPLACFACWAFPVYGESWKSEKVQPLQEESLVGAR